MKFNKKSLLQALLAYFGRCPTATRLRWGRLLGWLTPLLLRSRAHVVRVNLALCFPNLSERERRALMKRHFRLLAQSFIDRGLCWFGATERVIDTIQLHGEAHFRALLDAKRPILLFAPHFIGLDAAASRMTLIPDESATLYTPQHDPAVDEIVREGRARFNQVHLVSRRDGVRGLIRYLRKGFPVYYLPDMDFGRKGSAFIPFFGIPAATLLSAAQIAGAWDAAVLPVISRLDLETGCYHIQIGPVLEDFPGADGPEAATARLNQLIEAEIKVDPAQYYWVHRRFKTRPPGEAGFY